VYTIPQLEQIIREWVARVYHRRPHQALTDPRLPGVHLSPAERFEQGIAVAGSVRVPTDPSTLIEMLPVVHRTINHYGVEIHGLRYTGAVIAKYSNRARSTAQGRKWPFFIDPDDVSKVYFHDPEDQSWAVLQWEHADVMRTPFSLDALEYAKRVAVAQNRPAQVDTVAAELLARWGAARDVTPTERRMSARAAARFQASSGAVDGVWSLHSVRRLLQESTPGSPTTGEPSDAVESSLDAGWSLAAELTGEPGAGVPTQVGPDPDAGDDDGADDLTLPVIGGRDVGDEMGLL
jgi:hypothetical protein